MIVKSHHLKECGAEGEKDMKNNIINLTQHVSTAEQGCFEPADKKTVQGLLTFVSAPTKVEMKARASKLAQIAVEANAEAAMIGGAPYFMSTLETALKEVGVKPLYAFSERVSVEEMDENGNVVKRNVFRHAGWVEA